MRVSFTEGASDPPFSDDSNTPQSGRSLDIRELLKYNGLNDPVDDDDEDDDDYTSQNAEDNKKDESETEEEDDDDGQGKSQGFSGGKDVDWAKTHIKCV
jgi:hypothetical protein